MWPGCPPLSLSLSLSLSLPLCFPLSLSLSLSLTLGVGGERRSGFEGCIRLPRQRGRGGSRSRSQRGPRPGDTGDRDGDQAGRGQSETHLGRLPQVVGGRRQHAPLSSLPVPRGSASVQHPLLGISHPLCPLLTHSPQATCSPAGARRGHDGALLLPCGAGTSDPPPAVPSPLAWHTLHSALRTCKVTIRS